MGAAFVALGLRFIVVLQRATKPCKVLPTLPCKRRVYGPGFGIGVRTWRPHRQKFLLVSPSTVKVYKGDSGVV